jgi:hypothetical protein
MTDVFISYAREDRLWNLLCAGGPPLDGRGPSRGRRASWAESVKGRACDVRNVAVVTVRASSGPHAADDGCAAIDDGVGSQPAEVTG